MTTLSALRYLFAAVLVFLLTVPLSASAQPAAPAATKHWVFFTDKADDAGRVRPAEPGYVSARALERRRRRGLAEPGMSDAPLSTSYVRDLSRRGIMVRTRSRWLNAVSAMLTEADIEAVRALPYVRAVRPVSRLTPVQASSASATPAPTPVPLARKPTRLDYGDSRFQLEFINAIEPLERGINGQGVVVGFLDTEYGGFAHPALAHVAADGRLLADSNFVGQPQSDRHGRLVASIAVGFDEGQLIGPGHGATVIAATTEYAPTETNQEEDNFVRALEWMERMGVDVVNASLGYNIFDAGQRSYTLEDLNGDTAVTTRAVDVAASMGIVMVVAAGNEGVSSWGSLLTPADADSVITVGAAASNAARASFSSTGPTADGRIKPDVAALGVSVRDARTDVGYASDNGTSVAAPLVTGVVAQMLQVNPDLTPMDIRYLLRDTASQSTNPDNNLGWGIINADAAVRRAEITGTATEPESSSLADYDVRPIHPNPVTGRAVLDVVAPPGTGQARLSLFNVLGQEVRVAFDGPLHAGLNRLDVSTDGLPPGLYVYHLRGGRSLHTGTMVVIR